MTRIKKIPITGIQSDNVAVEETDDALLKGIYRLAERFEEVTGKKAYLIGTQDIH